MGDGGEFGPAFRQRPPSAKNNTSGMGSLESCGQTKAFGGLDCTHLSTVLIESQEVKFSAFLFTFSQLY